MHPLRIHCHCDIYIQNTFGLFGGFDALRPSQQYFIQSVNLTLTLL